MQVFWEVILTEVIICQKTEQKILTIKNSTLPEFCSPFSLLFYITNQQMMKSRHEEEQGLTG